MDLNNYFGEAEDRISELPVSLVHHILSFLDDSKHVARTSVLSKRWKYIWTSIPNLLFPSKLSLSENNKFMEFLDRTLLLHDTSSSILKFHLMTNEHMSGSRVHSWIENLINRNVQDLDIYFDQDKPFYIPLSLFTCQSLIQLELTVSYNCTIPLPKTFSFPKLKTLKLYGIQFTNDDCCWNEQHLSNCPVLENLVLGQCTWLGARNFCISSPTLKLLEFCSTWEDDGLEDCALEINAPNLVLFGYGAFVAKEYNFSSVQALKSAALHLFCQGGVPRKQNIGYGVAVNKLMQALSRVRSLEIYADTIEVLSIVNTLPTFHDLDQLTLGHIETTDASLFSLLKAVPNLKRLKFKESCIDNNKEKKHNWTHIFTAECIFQQLESVKFEHFRWQARQVRWLKLILKNAKALEAVILSLRSDDGINKEVLMSKLPSLPRASAICRFEFEEY